MKKGKREPEVPLPDVLDLPIVVAESKACRDIVLFTSRSLDAESPFTLSHHDREYKKFPRIVLEVSKEKDHFFGNGGQLHLRIRTKRLTEKGLFLKIFGEITSLEEQPAYFVLKFTAQEIHVVKNGSDVPKQVFTLY